MGKKHKKHHKSERRAPDDESSQDHPPEPLKLVVKKCAATGVPTSTAYFTTSTALPPPRPGSSQEGELEVSSTQWEEKKHKHKKKKKKKDKDKEKVRHHEEEAGTSRKSSPQGQAEGGEPPRKRMLLEGGVVEETVDGDADRPRREPRACTLREGDDNAILRQALLYFHNTMQKKDLNGFFAYPVTDAIAPGYSTIIHYPMDFSTMLSKIEGDEYRNILEYKKDLITMFNNAMIYNRPETIYYKEAKRLLHLTHRQFSKEKLLHMKKSCSFLSSVSLEELGLNAQGEFLDDTPTQQEEEQQRLLKERKKARNLSRFEAIPDNLTPEEILAQAQRAAKHAKAELSLRAPNSKMGFIRRREDGTTTFNFLNPDNDGKVSETERVVNLGSLVGKLNSGQGSLAGFKEDKRNRANPVSYLNYGPFSSFAPDYDTSFANVSKEDADILLAAYGDETGLQYAKSVMNFVTNSSDYAVRMVDNLLDILTRGEHSKAQRLLAQRKQVAANESQAAERPSSPSQEQSSSDAAATEPVEDVDLVSYFKQNKEVTPEILQQKLDHTALVINNLIQTQHERLSQRPPPHLSQIQGPSDKESELAEKLIKDLNQMLCVVKPRDIINEAGLQKAMGIVPVTSASSASATATATATATSNGASQAAEQPQAGSSAETQDLFPEQGSNGTEAMTS